MRDWKFYAVVAVFTGVILGASLATCKRAEAAFLVDAAFTWTPPTEREDGTALPQSEIASYNIVCNRQGLPGYVLNISVLNDPGVGTSSHFEAGAFDGPGTYECRAYTVDTGGLRSVASNVATKKVTGNPNAPVNFDFEAQRQ